MFVMAVFFTQQNTLNCLNGLVQIVLLLACSVR